MSESKFEKAFVAKLKKDQFPAYVARLESIIKESDYDADSFTIVARKAINMGERSCLPMLRSMVTENKNPKMNSNHVFVKNCFDIYGLNKIRIELGLNKVDLRKI